MIVGSGMLARAFVPHFADDPRVVVFAAGVSNSGCTDEREFAREEASFADNVVRTAMPGPVVYFSTCSVEDPEVRGTPYVCHKLRMEALVRAQPRHLVVRLPQVVGVTPNPHTLLNYLHARVVRSERFALWTAARRNVIDLDDVVSALLARLAIRDGSSQQTLNIASTRSHSTREIVAALERATGKRAIFDEVTRGSTYEIDVGASLPLFAAAGIQFDDGYLDRVVQKYYG